MTVHAQLCACSDCLVARSAEDVHRRSDGKPVAARPHRVAWKRGGGGGVCIDCGETTQTRFMVHGCPGLPDSIRCVQCGAEVEDARRVYAIPTCYGCLPPPEPLQTIDRTPQDLSSHVLWADRASAFVAGLLDARSR